MAIKTPKEHLEKALELIKAGWTQGAGARNKHGLIVPTRDETATCYCLDGALYKNINPYMGNQDLDTIDGRARSTIRHVINKKYGPSKYSHNYIILFNDTPGRTKEEVIEVLEEAIRLCTPVHHTVTPQTEPQSSIDQK